MDFDCLSRTSGPWRTTRRESLLTQCSPRTQGPVHFGLEAPDFARPQGLFVEEQAWSCPGAAQDQAAWCPTDCKVHVAWSSSFSSRMPTPIKMIINNRIMLQYWIEDKIMYVYIYIYLMITIDNVFILHGCKSHYAIKINQAQNWSKQFIPSFFQGKLQTSQLCQRFAAYPPCPSRVRGANVVSQVSSASQLAERRPSFFNHLASQEQVHHRVV